MDKIYNKIFFDFDSTLIQKESLDMLGEMKGVGNKVREITQKAMSGDIPFEASFEDKMNILSPSWLELSKVAEECKKFLVKDAQEVVSALQSLNKEVYILTSNFYDMVLPTAVLLGIPKENIIANKIFFNEKGEYEGFDKNSKLCANDGKARMLREYLKENDVSVFVGDGVTDLSTKGVASLFVGFGGVSERKLVKEKADMYFNTESITTVLSLIFTEAELNRLEENKTTTTTTTTRP